MFAVAVISPSASSVVVATPQPGRGGVRLLGEHQMTEQAGRPADPEDQYTRRHRVKCARVPDLAGARESAYARHHIV